ncbi:hypothetical protein SAMN02746065_10930 [Desulfocicer vacuolatum DSM 3385]|uniref:Uncharacterized protein n=1 Tax=Desulfocicer vacuolatum DSM 3385 TaxID=1121400 RepID=A0A1W2BPK7_9BACT|nr:hypothetical protein SAMN02746065_10930 [Desulfocicer vacuolatum DSM 3385]
MNNLIIAVVIIAVVGSIVASAIYAIVHTWKN